MAALNYDALDLAYERMAGPREVPEIDKCYECDGEMESAVCFNVNAGEFYLKTLLAQGVTVPISDRERLRKGLLCTSCMERLQCPNCDEIGYRQIPFDNGVCSETGYHDEGTRCLACIGQVEDEAEQARRRPPQSDRPRLIWDTAVALNRAAAIQYRRKEVA